MSYAWLRNTSGNKCSLFELPTIAEKWLSYIHRQTCLYFSFNLTWTSHSPDDMHICLLNPGEVFQLVHETSGGGRILQFQSTPFGIFIPNLRLRDGLPRGIIPTGKHCGTSRLGTTERLFLLVVSVLFHCFIIVFLNFRKRNFTVSHYEFPVISQASWIIPTDSFFGQLSEWETSWQENFHILLTLYTTMRQIIMILPPVHFSFYTQSALLSMEIHLFLIRPVYVWRNDSFHRKILNDPPWPVSRFHHWLRKRCKRYKWTKLISVRRGLMLFKWMCVPFTSWIGVLIPFFWHL